MTSKFHSFCDSRAPATDWIWDYGESTCGGCWDSSCNGSDVGQLLQPNAHAMAFATASGNILVTFLQQLLGMLMQQFGGREFEFDCTMAAAMDWKRNLRWPLQQLL